MSIDRVVVSLARTLALVSLIGCSRTGLGMRDAGPLLDAAPDDAPPLVEIPLGLARVEVLMVVDRSGSMQLSIEPGGASRWDALLGALARASAELDEVAVGASLFPAERLPGGEDPARFCATMDGLALAPALGGLPRLVEHMRSGPPPRGGTPTAAALEATLASLDPASAARRALVLITDGAPNCAPDPAPEGCACSTVSAECEDDLTGLLCIDDDGTLAAIEQATRRGIPVVVVGIDDPARPELSAILDRMAIAGGHPRRDGPHRYYAARSAAELREALVAIGREVSPCTFVPDAVGPLDGVASVSLGGAPIAPGPIDGWTPSPILPGAIQLHGAACAAAVRTGAPVVAWIELPPESAAMLGEEPTRELSR